MTKSRSSFTRLSGKPNGQSTGFSKPILKQKDGLGPMVDLEKLNGKEAIETDYFKYPTSSIQKKREEHLKQTLQRANRELASSQQGYNSYDAENRPPAPRYMDEFDVEM